VYVPRPWCLAHHQPPVKKKESVDQLVSCCWLPRRNQSRHKSSKHLTWESTFQREPCIHQDLPRRRHTRYSRHRSVKFILEIFQKPWTKGPLILIFFKKPELSIEKKSSNQYFFLNFNLFYSFFFKIPNLWEPTKDNQLFSNFQESALWKPA